MDKYVYLIAQLPSLVFDKSSYMNIPLFLEEAEKWMGSRDVQKLQSIALMNINIDVKDMKVVRQVKQFEAQLRQDLARWRQAVKKGIEYKSETFQTSLIKEGNPLEIEKKLLRLRWQFIESLEGDHHFDKVVIILYYLKLQILQKLSEYDKDKGMERFQQISKVME